MTETNAGTENQDAILKKIKARAGSSVAIAIVGILLDFVFGLGVIVGIIIWCRASGGLSLIKEHNVGVEFEGTLKVARILSLLAIGFGIIPLLITLVAISV